MLSSLQFPLLLLLGLTVIVGLYGGKATKRVRLPSIIGYMVVGVLLGPSLLDLLSETRQEEISFITDIALGFVALTIGLELSFNSLRKQGWSMVLIIITESFLAFALVTAVVTLLTGNLAMALLFGAIAPASAPAGTVAVIQEYRSRGPLTRALYSVVGFDDGLGIVIFGFASAIAIGLVEARTGASVYSTGELLLAPLVEIGVSIGVGGVVGLLFSLLARRLKSASDLFILSTGAVFIVVGSAELFSMSLILSSMVVGIVTVNALPHRVSENIRSGISGIMPLLFVLFFVLAGGNLHVTAIPALGLIGLVYILGRSAGLVSGAWLGATVGRAEPVIKKYLGLGILSQAGVAIGLALAVKQEFTPLGELGAEIGAAVITTITATSIFFELIGPILTKHALQKAGEISEGGRRQGG
jgi:Kef-type K+ transport system membrane component KefB